jgi:TonB family protein
MKNLRLIFLLQAALGASLTAHAQFVQRDYVPMRFIETDSAIFPPSLIPLGISSGEARVAVQVDESGQLTDYLVVAYTHPAFADEAVAAAKAWHYRPAMVHGFARSATSVLDFKFRAGKVVVDLTVDSAAAMFHFRLAPSALAYSVCSLDQLDHIPTPTKMVKPSYTPDQANRSHARHVTVDFYIDEKGHVRLPAVSRQMDESDEELSAAAVSAVEQWQFEAPVSKGKPVFVLAQQDFDFK